MPYVNIPEPVLDLEYSSFQTCAHCGLVHILGGLCPTIKSIEYYPDGRVKRVEYHDESKVSQPKI